MSAAGDARSASDLVGVGIVGTLRFAAVEIRDPLQASLLLTAIAATLATTPGLRIGLGGPAIVGVALSWRSSRLP